MHIFRNVCASLLRQSQKYKTKSQFWFYLNKFVNFFFRRWWNEVKNETFYYCLYNKIYMNNEREKVQCTMHRATKYVAKPRQQQQQSHEINNNRHDMNLHKTQQQQQQQWVPREIFAIFYLLSYTWVACGTV